MQDISIQQALQEAIVQEMNRNVDVFLMGEDIRIGGGFGITKGLLEIFGEERVLDTPVSETGFIGTAIGAAIMGMRPIAEFQFGDFVFCAMDQIINEAAKIRYMSGGQICVPIVFRLPIGANRRAAQHSQCSESVFMNIPGLKLVAPSTPYDAKGLMISAIRDNNPVLIFEHKLLYHKKQPFWMEKNNNHRYVPKEEYEIPFGKAAVRRFGTDVTIVATHLMLYRSLEAVEDLEKEGMSIEVIDPRTLVPLDKKTIIESVKKTGRLIVVHEAPLTGGWAGEVVASISEELGNNYRIKRIASHDVPIPYSPILEDIVIPSTDKIKKEIVRIMK